ncbi:MAG: protease pro-enzyme activation domain-containing protein [Candidatus Solibacter sp.]
MNKHFYRFVFFCAFLLPVTTQLVHAQPSRLHGAIGRAGRTTLAGHVSPQAAADNDTGRLDPATEISQVTLTFAPSPGQQAELDQLLERQQDPASPDYHRWLTPEEYGARFGLSESDVAAVEAWLQAQGLAVSGLARSRTWVSVSGSAAQVEQAFRTELHHYTVNGEAHFANAVAPSLPLELSGVVRSVRGLNDFRPRPFKHALRARDSIGGFRPNYTSSKGNHYLAPADLATIYNFSPLYSAGIDGSGQRVVIAGQTRINLSDIQHFRSDYNLPASDPQVTLVPGSRDPGISTDDLDEAHLDIEWSGAAAPNVQILYVFAYNVMDAVQYAIDQNLAPVISTSYGSCELVVSTSDAQTMRAWARQANAQGITWFSASGDSGAADCAYLDVSTLSVDFPASIPEVTSIGGTEFQENDGTYWSATNSATSGSALSYIPEVAWNDSVIDGEPSATGGGVSRFFGKPSWQTGDGVPTDLYRHVPDVSMSASARHDGYLVYTQGANYAFGGTSVPTPIYAGVAALMNQYLVARGVQSTPGLGNLNPGLYALAASTPQVFHDIVAGDNIVTVTCPPRGRNCTPGTGGYSAGVGYDQTTGLGSVDVYQLVTRWAGAPVPALNETQFTLQTAVPAVRSADTVFLTATATSTSGTTPTGTVTFNQGSNALGSASLVGGAGVATATLAVNGTQLAQSTGKVSATLNGGISASVSVSFVGTGASGTATPSIASITNGASFQPSIAPGAIVSVFGSQLAAATALASTLPLPVTLSGVAATINGIAAPLWYVSAGQINLQVPYQVPAGATATLVINNNGQTGQATFPVGSVAPGIFTDTASTLVPAGSAARGQTVTLYFTGAGAVKPAVANGDAPAAGTAIAQLPAPAATSVRVGGVAAQVAFAGNPPGVAGVIQVNFVVPAQAPLGTQTVSVSLGGISSNAAKLTVTQ